MVDHVDSDKAYYQAVICPAEGAPSRLVCGTEEEFLPALHARLMEARSGWAFITVHGKAVRLSMPRQVFQLEGPGFSRTVSEPGLGAFDESGRFSVLQPLRDNP